MDKDLIEFLGFYEDEVITKRDKIDSDKLPDEEYKILKVKVFLVGLITNETINKLNSKSTKYKEFINLKNLELEDLKNNDKLLCDTDLVLLVGEYDDAKAMTKIEYILQNAELRDIKTVLLLSMNNTNKDLIKEISTKTDVLVPIIDNQAQKYEQNAFNFLDRNNLKEELAQQYLNTILEFAPKCVGVIEPLGIIDILTHNKGIAYVSSATATGEGKAEKAASLALNNIYSWKDYKDCKILLMTISGGESLGLLEINDAAQLIAESYGDEETVLFTVVIDESIMSEIRVSIVGI